MFSSQRACTDSEIIGFYVPVCRCSCACFGVMGSQLAKRCNYFMKTGDTERARGEEKKINLSTLSFLVKFTCVVPTVQTSVTAIKNWRFRRHVVSYIKQITHIDSDTPRTSALNVSHTPVFLHHHFLIGRKNTIIRYFTSPKPRLKY